MKNFTNCRSLTNRLLFSILVLSALLLSIPGVYAQGNQDEMMKNLRDGAEKVQSGKFQDSIEPLKKALTLNPDKDKQAIAYYLLGLAYTGLQNSNEAIEAYKQSVTINPGFLNGQIGLGTALFNAKRFAEAADAYKQVVKLDPKSFNAYFSMGAALVQLQRFDEAIEPLKKAAELKPDLAQAHHYLGMIYVGKADKDAAMKEYEQLKGSDAKLAQALLSEIEKLNAAPANPTGRVNIGFVTIKNKSGQSMPTPEMRVRMIRRVIDSNFAATPLEETDAAKVEAEAKQKGCDYILYTEIGRITNERPTTDSSGGGLGNEFTEVRITIKLVRLGEKSSVFENTTLGREPLKGRESDLGLPTVDNAARELVNELKKKALTNR